MSDLHDIVVYRAIGPWECFACSDGKPLTGVWSLAREVKLCDEHLDAIRRLPPPQR